MVFKIVFIIIGVLILLALLIIFIPMKLEIKYKTEDESSKSDLQKEADKKTRDNYLKIYLLGIIPIKKVKLEVKKKTKMLENNGVIKDIINTIFSLLKEYITMQNQSNEALSRKDIEKFNKRLYFKKLELKLGFNFYSTLLNAYIMAFINGLLPILVASNDKKIDERNFKYFTYISNKQIYNLNFFCIVNVSLVNTINVIMKLRKVAKKYGKTNTSNRRFNDDSNDVA